MIALVDYGTGNLRSVEKALETLGCNVNVTSKPNDVQEADAVIFPGVGAFSDCMGFLIEKGLDNALLGSLQSGKPYLGICLGMQVLFEESFEGGATKGLGFFKGKVKQLPDCVKVPHMGWNRVKSKHRLPLFEDLEDPIFAYFVHSFYADAKVAEDILCTTDYGLEFTSGVYKEKIFGLQFHPEKSGEKGLKILKNFVELSK